MTEKLFKGIFLIKKKGNSSQLIKSREDKFLKRKGKIWAVILIFQKSFIPPMIRESNQSRKNRRNIAKFTIKEKHKFKSLKNENKSKKNHKGKKKKEKSQRGRQKKKQLGSYKEKLKYIEDYNGNRGRSLRKEDNQINNRLLDIEETKKIEGIKTQIYKSKENGRGNSTNAAKSGASLQILLEKK